ncbi:hypothetical protein B0T36_06875 [Nocardia donostiensis]|uniref:hypothetical protein n=1 Tax=Nocardia donostiensis TaxID=1538463 RepID=UPI0009DA7D9F|nr:hypothetical protein [Nocardia donostiensis]OQS15707.1 hypothetical protein B0T36_06875 [Nocardia donostiensis]
MDVGQGNANALWQQAVSGTFRMERGVAEECAKVYTRLVDTVLDEQINKSERLSEISGFGGFVSAQELQAGFAAKGAATTEALTGLKESALRMAAAFLQAGGAFEEADAMNRRAIEAAWKAPKQ